MIFVDTSIWYSAHVVEDKDHTRARELLLSAPSDFITTDNIVDELLTLLVARNQRDVAVRIGDGFWSERLCRLHWISHEDALVGWQVFISFNDKKWSFTDCVSYAVMKRLGIREAFAQDDDFRQFGFVSVKS
jgi:uncharacterized protein